jgi:hypothetical protein
MKVYGFSFIRNALQLDYPIKEALLSILPLCDKIFVAVGQSDDDTEAYVRNIDSEKIVVIPTIWDDTLRTGGRVLAVETDKAYAAIPDDADWCIYIQGDEVLHENGHQPLKEQMQRWKDYASVDGLLCNYLHFYGSYDYVGESFRWYRREIRVVRKREDIFSYKDAQGFRKGTNKKLRVKHSGATMHHYGWVRDPRKQKLKLDIQGRFWHSDEDLAARHVAADTFDYGDVDALSLFKGSHPKVMQERIQRLNWQFTHDLSRNRFTAKEKFQRWFERLTGYRLWEYKNYELV